MLGLSTRDSRQLSKYSMRIIHGSITLSHIQNVFSPQKYDSGENHQRSIALDADDMPA